MPLATGSRLGTHEIIGLLGAGGMGEVYRALDTKLNRQVAIKVLPEAYASDADRVSRFHREAQAVAALNHPNIAAIYDLAESDPSTGSGQAPIKYLVLELVEGDTLADRIRRGAIPIDETLTIVKQILEALEVAHEKGICHRDLKPANIKLTPDGAVKVLDFGLAKFLQSSPSAPNTAHSPTMSVAGTYPGVILGTAGYMSPEQAKGHEADQRSDLFSVGCILYELLTGRQAFDGETASEILASVLKTEVDLTTLPPRLNPRLVELLRRCLEKNPRKRWHAAADVRVEIEAVMGRALVIDAPRADATGARSTWRLTMVVAASALVAGLASGYAAWTLKPELARTTTRFSVAIPEGELERLRPNREVISISPDGTNLVYASGNRLFLRSMSGLELRAIAGSETGPIDPSNPAFSPDGQALAFYSGTDQTLKRLALGGGSAVTLCAVSLPLGISWDEHGIVFGQVDKGILRVSPNGGVPEVIAAVGSDQVAAMPQMLPGGKAVIFSLKPDSASWDSGQVVVQTIGGDRKTLVVGGASGRYLPTGHLVYALSGVLLAVPFDLASLSVSGGPVPVVEGVRRAGFTGRASGGAHFSVAANGALAYVPGPAVSSLGSVDLVLADRKGVLQPLKLKPGAYRSPRVSPDGKFVAFDSEHEKESVVWIYELSGASAMRRLTFEGKNRSPVWSADGLRVAFQSDRDGDLAVFQQPADGSGTAERLTRPEAGTSHEPQSWSPDGAHLMFGAQKDGQWTLWTLAMKDRTTPPFGAVRSVERAEGVFSPNGRWVAYQASERAGGRQVFVQPFPTTGAKYLVGTGGQPYWSPNGNELLLNAGPTRSIVIPVTTTPRVAFGQPVDFPRRGRNEGDPAIRRRNADSMPDGQHIVGVASGEVGSAQDDSITVVLNWFDEVRQKAPRR